MQSRPTDDSSGIAYVEQRVVFHNDSDAFAIHDVYFDNQGEVVTMTEDALSPRAGSVSELQSRLENLSDTTADGAKFASGDLHYTYDREDLNVWIAALSLSLIMSDFDKDG